MRLRLDGDYLNLDQRRRVFTDADRAILDDLLNRYQAALGLPPHPGQLPDIGDALFRWLDGDQGWGQLVVQEAAGEVLEIQAAATESALLDAPWELLRQPGQPWCGPPLEDPAFLVRSRNTCPVRRVLGKSAKARAPSPHALSVLFMAASPQGQDRLAFEAEEVAISRAVGRLPLDLVVEETGDPTELGTRLAGLAPVDVLHLSCHGRGGADPVLLLEDEQGKARPTTAAQLRTALGANARGLGLCVVSACETAASSPLGSLVRSLVAEDLPAVLGWAASVGDHEATCFAAALYRHLAAGSSLGQALGEARRTHVQDLPHGTEWHLPRLYLGPAAPQAELSRRNGRRRFDGGAAQSRFLGENRNVPVARPDQFVGRRRALQRCIRALQDGDHVGVLLHGVGQQGKSSLAARIADRLCASEHRYRVVVCHGRLELDARSVLETVNAVVGDAAWGDRWRQQWETDPLPTLEPALRAAVREHRLLLVLDDLEQVLDPQRKPVVPRKNFGSVLGAILRAFSDADSLGRLVITSRFDFALPGQVLTQPLHQLLYTESLRALRDSERARLEQGAGADATLRSRCLALGRGNPGLTTRLLLLAEQAPDSVTQVLDQLDDADISGISEPKIIVFFQQVALDAVLALLDPADRSLALAASLFQAPVPRAVLSALAPVVQVDKPATHIDRLLALGVCEARHDSARSDQPELYLSDLLRPLLGDLDPAIAAELRPVAITALQRTWGLNGLPPTATLELYRLALAAQDGDVLVTLAKPALRLLEASHQTKDAAAQGAGAAVPASRGAVHFSRVGHGALRSRRHRRR
ncbi:MAG: CHAT domain-containing protein [Oligoflexia bacterium]|nr:CHAT domain-containing protein [Oligoflexia bacterium]